MSRAVDQELDRLFAEAERSKTCLVAPSERTARLLNQRARAGHVVRPLALCSHGILECASPRRASAPHRTRIAEAASLVDVLP